MKIRIRRLLLPILFCLAVACLIEIPMSQTSLFGDQVILWDTLFRAIAAVPVLYYFFYQEDRVFRGEEQFTPASGAGYFFAGFFASAAGNFLIGSLGLSGTEAANETLLIGPLWLQLIVLLAASPLLEEFFFRGILYMRLKEIVPASAAGILSAAAFGLYHGNLAQGIYGFFMGLLLAYAMERSRTVKAPILVHIGANLAGILLALV